MYHGNLPSVKYAPSTDRRSENQIMMIKVRHTDCQLFACVRRVQSDFMEGIYCKKYQWGPKIRNLISVSTMDIRHFHVEATLDTTDVDYLNSFVKTFLECRKMLVQRLPS